MILFIILINKKLKWKCLLPDLSRYAEIFNQPCPPFSMPMVKLQSRLLDAITKFCHPNSPSKFMLLAAMESEEYFQLISNTIESILPKPSKLLGSSYIISGISIMRKTATKADDNFAAHNTCIWRSWANYEQIFGAVKYYKDMIDLQPGLVHLANGGVLILGACTFVNQPLLWFRLKQIILTKCFDWISLSENHSLKLKIPSMPLNLSLIIIGDRQILAELSNIEPEINRLAMYGEFESELRIDGTHNMINWCRWVNTLAKKQGINQCSSDAWPELIKQSVRYSGDKFQLPLCPQWLSRRLREASFYSNQKLITASHLFESEKNRIWRETYLSERMIEEIIEDQITIKTNGEVIGQINALSILDIPGYPLSLGYPSRISCIVHIGDGEIHDVERKSELGGNIHAKGMMIMQSFLMGSLKIDHQLPFSASIVFEQSYSEVDGDSASLAELAVLISALAEKPINQQIAVTGSVDQFGYVQSVGGINEKIEGFLALCQARGLTGKQGVIIPSANIRHLCLHENVIKTVREGKFSLWPVKTINEALQILTNMPFEHDKLPSLIVSIRDRIASINLRDRKRLPWFFRWIN